MFDKNLSIAFFVLVALAGLRAAAPLKAVRALDTKPPAEEHPQSKPPFARLSAQEEKRLAMLLESWRRGVASMERYRCQFRRWDFDATSMRSSPDVAHTFSTGVIQYASPNKLLYRVAEVKQAVQRRSREWKYATHSGANLQDWLYDGESLFVFDHHNKQLFELGVPSKMNGRAVGDRPPSGTRDSFLFGRGEYSLGSCYPLGGAECFVFGPKVGKIQDRFWLRVVPSEASDSEESLDILEAYPKASSEKLNFDKVELIVDPEDGLTKALNILLPRAEKGRRGDRVIFEFTDREVNAVVESDFPRPELPSGWKKIEMP